MLRTAVKGMDVGFNFRLSGAQEFGGFEIRDDLALVQEDDTLGEIECLVKIMSHEEDGLFEAAHEGAEHVLHLSACEGIECAEGLVHEQNCGVCGERAGETDTLSLAA